jgi:type II secretory pathway pseudopilin PulG
MAVNMQIGNIQNTKQFQAGFTYMGLLMVVAISGIGLAGVGVVWSHDAQREREKELLFIGDAYRSAIGSYYENGLGNKQFPTSLDELILDKRFPTIKRHIRQLYADPMMIGVVNNRPWGLILQKGKIVGVHTLSDDEPIKKTDFNEAYDSFAETKKYSDWKFIYTPNSIPASAPDANTSS